MKKSFLAFFMIFYSYFSKAFDGQSYLESMPEEIKLEILKYLPVSDIKNIRLISKLQHKFIDKFLIDYFKNNVIKINLNKNGFEVLNYLNRLSQEKPFLKIKAIGLNKDNIHGFLEICFNIVDLSLDHNFIGVDGAIALANSKNLINLLSLRLSYNEIGDMGIIAIANSKALINLRHLDLTYNHIGALGARAIADFNSFIHLLSLNLSINRVGSQGAIALANSQNLKSLLSLDLSFNDIGDFGALAIADSKYMITLQSLYLGGNIIRPIMREILCKRFLNAIDFDLKNKNPIQ